LTQATTKPLPCQVRSKTESPCLHLAVVEVLGVPFCEACAREQEAYFAIGELTREALEGIRRQRADGLAAARPLDFPRVDETERLALTKS
jgi:hypothetical protein